MTNLDVNARRWGNTEAENCKLLIDGIDYLGYGIKRRCLAVVSSTRNATQSIQKLYYGTDVSSFSGLCNVFFPLVPSSARIEAPLKRELQKTILASTGNYPPKSCKL